MIKLIALLKRNPVLTREEFHAHWRDVHGPLIRDTPDLARHIVRYEQHPRLAADYDRPGTDEWDGVAIQWLESFDSLIAFVSEPAYRDILSADEKHLLDMDNIQVVFTEEPRVVIDDA
jgi:hypothetical protein